VREQRTIFGEVPELYDKARAGWPAALIDEVLAFVGPHVEYPALDIGAGTGKATVAFAARGLEIVALEPDAAMAAVARRNCERFPKVAVEVTTFEDWPLQPGRFGLLLSAQAWHWVAPEIRCAKSADALVPGGTLALFWHLTNWRDEELRAELEELYRRLMPDLHAQKPGFPGLGTRREDDRFLQELAASSRVQGPRAKVYTWDATFTPDAFEELLLTQSNHRLLAEGERAVLFAALRELIAAHGGSVTVPRATLLILARRRD
jgi:SAM-dependent methyltransferase